jgi:small subunit ribosomal protein S20
MKTSIKKVMEADKKDAPELLNQAISTIDHVCAKGIIHKNRASHHKSKLTKYINSL